MNHKPRILNSALPMGKTWFEIRDAVKAGKDEVCEIRIMDDIGGFGISARYLTDRIKSLSETTRIKLHIFSGGGDVLEGNEIYNALKEHKGGVDVTLGALCASIATVIACAGDTIKMAKNGMFMVHNPSTIAWGESEDFRKLADIMDKMKKVIVDTYHDRTGLKPEELTTMMNETTWLNAEEAQEKKFIDAISGNDDDGEAVLKNMDLSKFRNSAKLLSRVKASQVPEGTGDNPAPGTGQGGGVGNAKPQTQPAIKTTPSLLDNYMNGKVRIFCTASIASFLGAGLYIPHASVARIFNDDPEKDVETRARELYQAKLKRDKEIDDMVIAVRNRDKKDFSGLAAEFKSSDKTVDEFARALVVSDKFKPHTVVGEGEDIPDPSVERPSADYSGSGITVVGVHGLPKGSPGEIFVASAQYREIRDIMSKGQHKTAQAAVLCNQLMAEALGHGRGTILNTTTTSGLTSIQKLPGVVQLALRRLSVKDLIAPGATTNTTIRYIQETSFTNGADMVAEGGTKPAATFAFNETDATVKKIAVYTKVTDELYADFLAVASVINQRLPYMVERKEEDQLLNGDGTGQNLTGILATVGIQTQAVSTDTKPDALYKGITKVRWGSSLSEDGWEPDGIVMHPTDWQTLRLLKDGNDQYYGGGPFTGAYGNGPLSQFEVIWGKAVVVTPAIAQGTALIGAFRIASQYFQRSGLQIESTNTDQDDFIKNLTTIRAETRLALAVYYPAAFCQVTGL